MTNCKKSRRFWRLNSLKVASKFRTLLLSMLNPWSALIESMRAGKVKSINGLDKSSMVYR